MNINEKKNTVKELNESLKGARAVFFSNFQGLSAEKTRQLRRQLKAVGAGLVVAKNTLVTRALRNTGWIENDQTIQELTGPTAVSITNDEPAPALKEIFKFAKDNSVLQLKVGIYQKAILTIEKLKELSELPSKEIIISKLLGTIQNPLSRSVRVLKNPIQKLTIALSEVSKIKAKTEGVKI